MLDSFVSKSLPTGEVIPGSKSPLAILCLSLHWNAVEQQTLWLVSRLRHAGRPVTLVVSGGSPLHRQAQAQWLPCFVLSNGRTIRLLKTAMKLGIWLHLNQTNLLLTTSTTDLTLASLVKCCQPRQLRLLHRQLHPVDTSWPHGWWLSWQMRTVDAWLAPLPQQAQVVLAHTPLNGRRLWVVSPALPPYYTNGHGGYTSTEARRLLDLPPATQLIGTLDCGGDGPAFALEALYRLRQEHNSSAELVIMGDPATSSDAARWEMLQQLAQQLRLNHCVHWRPLHNTAAPFLLYSALSVVLLPTTQDATCLPVLNAMASGCPLVSAATADTADLLQHRQTAYLFAPRDVTACAKMLSTALDNSLQARQIAQQAITYAHQNHSPREQCLRLESILEYIGQRKP